MMRSRSASARFQAGVAGLDDGQRQADPVGGGLGQRAQLVVGLLGQPHHPRVVAEVVVAQLGLAVQAELAAIDGAGEGADQEVGQQVGARLLVEERLDPGRPGVQVVAVQPGQPRAGRAARTRSSRAP